MSESELLRVVQQNSKEIARLLTVYDVREVQPFDFAWLISNGA